MNPLASAGGADARDEPNLNPPVDTSVFGAAGTAAGAAVGFSIEAPNLKPTAGASSDFLAGSTVTAAPNLNPPVEASSFLLSVLSATVPNVNPDDGVEDAADTDVGNAAFS